MAIIYRPPDPTEAADITALCFASKASNGYDDAFMEACRDELTITEAQLNRGGVMVAEKDGRMIGFVQVVPNRSGVCLQDLFIAPDAKGSGVGKRLLKEAIRIARSLQADTMTIDADPHAEAFYIKYGAVRVGEVPSGSIPRRMLPQLEMRLQS